jgi:hypothetical protein
MKPLSLLIFPLFLLQACSGGGTVWGNPPARTTTSVELTQNSNLTVSSVQLCVTQLNFVPASGGAISVTPPIREVSVGQSIQSLGSVELEDLAVAQVEVSLKNECSTQKSVKLTNQTGTFGTADPTTARFTGGFTVNSSTRKITLNIQPLIDQFAGVSSDAQIPTVVSATTGSAAATTRASGSWLPTPSSGAPEARNRYAMAWIGSKIFIFGGNGIPAYGNGFLYDPIADAWSPISAISAPSPRANIPAIWTGSQVLVWGGNNYAGSHFNDGAKYDPVMDAWTPITTSGAPSARVYQFSVWTGQEMLVWGGTAVWNGSLAGLADGARYNPTANAWTPITTNNAPAGRHNEIGYFDTVWTGEEMIVWGGMNGAGTFYSDGARYNPFTDTWTTMSNLSAPAPREGHTTVWTGTEMIIWGGGWNSLPWQNTGGRYHVANNSWTPTSLAGAPTRRAGHAAVWTGKAMMIWGGFNIPDGYFNTGGLYDPATDQWTATSMEGAPLARSNIQAVWTGAEFIFWGGYSSSGYWGDGGRYVP